MTAALLTVAEVAQQLRVSRNTVLRLCARTELGSIRVGRQLRIDGGSVDRYVEQHTVRREVVNPRREEAWSS